MPGPIKLTSPTIDEFPPGDQVGAPEDRASGTVTAGTSVSATLAFPAGGGGAAYSQTQPDTTTGDGWWEVTFTDIPLGRTGGTLTVTAGGNTISNGELRTAPEAGGGGQVPPGAPPRKGAKGGKTAASGRAPKSGAPATFPVYASGTLNRQTAVAPVIVTLVRLGGASRVVVATRKARVRADDTWTVTFRRIPPGRYRPVAIIILRTGHVTTYNCSIVVVP